MTHPAIYIAPDADLTERQTDVYRLLIDREAGEFRPIARLSEELGDYSPNAIYATIEILERKGLVEAAPNPWGWRVKWIHRPAVYVRQGRREGFVLRLGANGEEVA